MNCNMHFCVRHEYAKAYVGQPHAHPCWEIVFYCKGTGTVKIGENNYTFSEDTFSVIPPNATHIEAGAAGTEVLYIGFDIVSNEFLKEGVFEEREYEIRYYLEKIYKETRVLRINRNSGDIINLLTQLITLSLIREVSREVGRDKYEIVSRAKAYIAENYMKDIDVKTIAKSVDYSYDYFRHIFFEVENMTVRDYIAFERVNKAKEMLLSKGFQVKEIAAACGFSSPSYFCAVFKKYTGKKPQAFIRQNEVFQKALYAKNNKK